jgi:hypothetical protein
MRAGEVNPARLKRIKDAVRYQSLFQCFLSEIPIIIASV